MEALQLSFSVLFVLVPLGLMKVAASLHNSQSNLELSNFENGVELFL